MPKKIPPALAKFQKRVKAIQRATGKSFRSAQKQASSENKSKGRGKKVSGRKKSLFRSKSPSRRIGVMTGSGETTRSAVSTAAKAVQSDLGWLLAAQRTARTKKEKKAMQPRINELTKQLKALRAH